MEMHYQDDKKYFLKEVGTVFVGFLSYQIAGMFRSKFDAETKVWRGRRVPTIFHRDLSLGFLLLKILQRNPSKIGQISANTGLQLTNRELHLRSVRVAQNLLKLHKPNQGDVIGIVCANSENVAPVCFAAFICGTPISPLDPRFQEDEITHVYGITKPKLVFCDAINYDVVKKSVDALQLNCPIYIMQGDVPQIPNVIDLLKEFGTEEDFIPPNLKKGGDELAVILCSSGTTGLPKGVSLSHAVLNSFYDSIDVNSEDIMFNFSTLYWITGIINLVFCALSGATRVVTDKRFSPELALEIIEKYKVTHVTVPPLSVLAILNCPDLKERSLDSVRAIMCGGSACPVAIAEEASKYLKNGKFQIVYGLTELGNACSLNTTGQNFESVGKLNENLEARIVDEDGKYLGVGETGELVIRSPFLFSGYYGNKEATQEVLDPEGWFWTGDIGCFDAEGFLYIKGRQKAVFKHKGYTVYPDQIEAVIAKMPGVLYVCVCGVSDGFIGDVPAAAIVKKPGANVTEADVVKFVSDNMLEYNHLAGGIYFVDAIPTTPSGKFRQREIHELLKRLHHQRSKNIM